MTRSTERRRLLAGVLFAVALALAMGIRARAVYSALDQVTVDGTAGGVGFTQSKYAPNGLGNDPRATIAYCQLRSAEISYTYDGTPPTATVGMLWEPGEIKTFYGFDVIRRFRAIRTGSSGQLDCTHTAP